jgi:hypothetical protein
MPKMLLLLWATFIFSKSHTNPPKAAQLAEITQFGQTADLLFENSFGKAWKNIKDAKI